MKRLIILCIMLMSMVVLTACEKNNNVFNMHFQNEPKKIHEDIASENIHHVTLSGNAQSIVIRQSADEYFKFQNGDLNDDHTYEVRCDETDGTLDICILMEQAENDNDILGSVLIDIPQKEFEEIEVTGDFRQIFLYTMNSDVLIHAANSFVNLDLEADYLKHNITLDGSEANAFRGVSIYLDQYPDPLNMELNIIPGGIINDPQNLLKERGLASDSGKPVISINHTPEINIYQKE